MSLLSFKYFLVAAEELHFTNAAKRLYISQQSLSWHIQKLEEQYDVILFERRPQLRLTPAGKYMAKIASKIIEMESQMVAEFADITKSSRGKLIVGISSARARLFMPDIWRYYKELYPNVDVCLVEENTMVLEEKLRNGKIDIYIGVDSINIRKVHKVFLVSEQICCIVSARLLKDHFPNNYQEYVTLFHNGVDLYKIRHLPFILLPRRNRLRAAIDYCFDNCDITPRVIFETNDHTLVYNLCQLGFGVGFVSQMYIYRPPYSSGQHEKLHVFPLKDDPPVTKMIIAYREDRHFPNFAREFIRVTQRVFQDYSRWIKSAQFTRLDI